MTHCLQEYFPIDGFESVVKSGRWKTQLENDPNHAPPSETDSCTFLLRFDLTEPHKDWSGETVRRLKVTTSRAGLVVEGLGDFLIEVVEGFLLDEKPDGERTCFSHGKN
jgi:hypothetical protein